MKKKLLVFAITATLALSLVACNKDGEENSQATFIEPVNQTSEQIEVVTSETTETSEVAVEVEEGPVRADGERFETTIMLEGMEETVQYEHIKNDAIGYEMDYDYESFKKESEGLRDRIVSVYDNEPENYMLIMYWEESPEDAVKGITEELSGIYDVEVQDYTLENAGACKRIPAEVLKGTNDMAEELQMVYVIPAGNGSIVVRDYYTIEAAEGFGHRFKYMLNTLKVIK